MQAPSFAGHGAAVLICRLAARKVQNAIVAANPPQKMRALIQFKPIRLTRIPVLLRTLPTCNRGEGRGERRMNASKAVQADRAEAGQLKELLALHEAALASMSRSEE